MSISVLDFSLNAMRTAMRPEDVFGENCDEHLLKLQYRQLSRALHPDQNENSPESHEAFTLLQAFYEDAQRRMEAGTYGSTAVLWTFTARGVLYEMFAELPVGTVSRCYRAHRHANGTITEVVVKLSRHPRNNDLLAAEAKILKSLKPADDDNEYIRRWWYEVASINRPYPELIDSAVITQDGRQLQVNVLDAKTGCYSLREVMAAYPQGVDPRHMAWVFRRVLMHLGYLHQRNIIHGAVTPDHIMIRPETHEVFLVGFTQSVKTDGKIPLLAHGCEDYYPPEVTEKLEQGPGTDIYMAVCSMVALMGAEPNQLTSHDNIPAAIRAFTIGCRLPKLSSRPQDAWQLLDEFDLLLQRMWGPRKFIEFKMP